MGRLIEMSEARALVADGVLWPRVRDFLWNFAPQVHKSWLEGIGGGAVPAEGLMPSSRVKAWILSQLGAEPFFHDFPASDWSRLALLDGAVIKSIVLWLGALACAPWLRKVTDGATVRSLKAALPEVYPDVLAFTAYFTKIGEARAAEDGEPSKSAVDCVVAAGCELLLALLGDAPAQVKERVALKLPKTFPFKSAASKVPPPGRDVLDAALARLLKLKFPEAHSLCC